MTNIDPATRLFQPIYTTEPVYWRLSLGNSSQPMYWLVVDGERHYFDRNANGDLSDKDSLVELSDRPSADTRRFRLGELIERGQKQPHKKLLVFEYGNSDGINLRIQLNWGVIQGAYSIGSRDPNSAPIICLNGPLALAPGGGSGEFFAPVRSERGQTQVQITAVVGTPNANLMDVSPISYDLFPSDTFPVAIVEFLDDSGAASELPLVINLSLRTCGCQLYALLERELIKNQPARTGLAITGPSPFDVASCSFETVAVIDGDNSRSDSQ